MKETLGRVVEIKITSREGVSIPEYATQQASGADVRAHLIESVSIEPGRSAQIPTGLFFAIPEGYEIQVRPRSGLALRNQLTVLNTPGTIDSDYRGELFIILINHGREPFLVTNGMRIAQIVVAPVMRAAFQKKESFTVQETERGDRGFGHTGLL